jgi:hypothetical protein
MMSGCDSCGEITAVDPAVGDGGFGGTGGGSGTTSWTVVDPPPPDAGFGGQGGAGGTGGSGGAGGMIVDPPPPDAGQGALDPRLLHLPLIDKWTDTAPSETVRTADLPLYDPPQMALAARREDDTLVVRLEGLTALVSTRWEGDGEIEGAGPEVRWRPTEPSDRLRVAIRSRGGVAVLSLRAEEASPGV